MSNENRSDLYLAALLRGVAAFLGRDSRGRAEPGTQLADLRRGFPEHPLLNEEVLALASALPMKDEQGEALSAARVLLDLASRCARGAPATEPDKTTGALPSPFTRITLPRGGSPGHALHGDCVLDPTGLTAERQALFPVAERILSDGQGYATLVKRFREEWRQVGTPDELLALLEVYLHAVPHPQDPGIGLFDHTRVAAALAVCFHDAVTHGEGRGGEPEWLRDHPRDLPPPCLLVSGDVSGIQRFIFGVQTKGASKALKGRSWEIQLLTEACARRLLDALELPGANLLYNGGGNFFLLAPAHRVDELEQHRQRFVRELLEADLYLALGWTPVAVADFLDARFAACWREAHREIERRKARRFQELEADAVFTPFPQEIRDSGEVFQHRTERLTRAAAYRLERRGGGDGSLIARLGYTPVFVEGEGRAALVFNTTDFSGRFAGFRFAVKDLPVYTDALIRELYPPGGEQRRPQEVRAGGLIDFDHFARMAEERTGTRKLGVLKMDVDDLGRIFVEGLPERERGIAQIAMLSRTLKWFFEAYVNTLIQTRDFGWLPGAREGEADERRQAYHDQLYPVFSGGDDFFLVGAWDAVWEFARMVREEFREFVCGHPGVTLSAALLVLDPKFPVSRFAAEAERRLEAAKHRDPRKDRISVLDEVLTWDEFFEAAVLKRQLEVLVKQRGESRALLERVRRSAVGYGRLQEHAVRGRIRPDKVWRLAYFLARNAKRENLPEIRALAERHQKLLLDAFANPPAARNPALFGVAARWAELASRGIAPRRRTSTSTT
jgi:CRISPR-associated protein Csm1